MEAIQMFINRRVDKKVEVHIYNRILLGHKKEILPVPFLNLANLYLLEIGSNILIL